MSDVTNDIDSGNKARYAVVAVALVVAVLIGILATRPAAQDVVASRPLVGAMAPTFSGEALDGRPVSLEQYKGRYVVVNFFATWCIPCRNEHPQMVAFAERYSAPTDPAIVAVAYDKADLSAARSFFAQRGGDWPVLGEKGSQVAIEYGVRGLPESFIIGPDGRVVAQVTGEVTLQSLEALTGRVA